jgi:hypothetical protein
MSNPFVRRKARKFDEDQNVTIQPISDTRKHFSRERHDASADRISVEKPLGSEFERHSSMLRN